MLSVGDGVCGCDLQRCRGDATYRQFAPSSHAVAQYLTLIFDWAGRDKRGCLWFGDFARANIKFRKKTVTAYRFAYGIATVVPLSQTQSIRHECNNPFCVNPRHLLTGDQKDNFRDHLATQAYGTRWDLLRGWDSM